MEALAAVDGSGCAGNTFQLGNNSAFAQGVHDELGSQLCTQNVVGSDLAFNVNTVDSTVHSDDLNTLSLSSFHSAGNGVGVNGVDDQNGDTGSNQVFDIGGLLCGVIACVSNSDLNTQSSCLLFSAFHQGDEEGVVLSGNGQTDGTICANLDGGFLTVDNDSDTASHGHNQSQAQNQCEYFFHNVIASLLISCGRTELPPE